MTNWDNQIWAQDRKICGECGEQFHLSGTEECACRKCETESCDVVVNTKEATICVSCEDTEMTEEYELTNDAMDALSESMNPDSDADADLANLIAAIPDMLEALKAFVAAQYSEQFAHDHAIARKKARAAIAKAEGGA